MLCTVFISQHFLYKFSTWVWCPVLSFSCCNLSVSLCFSWFRKQFPERKKTLLFAASCSVHTSACALAASLDSSWFAGQYPDGRFITSNKSLAPCEHLRGISDHVASFSFRRGSSNYLWILGFSMLSAVFRSIIFGAFASRKQRYLRYVRLSVRMYSGESYRAGFRKISNLGLCWLKAYGNNENLRSRMISRRDWSSSLRRILFPLMFVLRSYELFYWNRMCAVWDTNWGWTNSWASSVDT